MADRDRDTVGQLQRRAWGHYGLPRMPTRAVGEVRYVVGWQADQMSRLDWDVWINGSEEWQITLPDNQGTISTSIDGEQDQTEASRQLLELIGWDDTTVRAVTTNLFVAGEGDYAELDDRWEVVSTIDPDRKKKLKAAKTAVPFIWPHPADPSKPDAPLFGVLEILDELDWLNRQSRTQSRQRALISGIVGTADGLTGKDGGTFWDEWNAMFSRRMIDPDDLSPLQFSGGLDLVKDGVNWIFPPFGYDQVLDRKVTAAIQRLAYGLPIPPEILLGLQAPSRATAFVNQENSYRAHIEPAAMLVAQVPQDVLTMILDDNTQVEVRPNPSRLLARKNSVQDVKDAWDRGLVTPDYVREVLGIPEDAAPDPSIDGMPRTAPAMAPTDPANVAADEPVTASTSPDLSSLLADIDAALASELAGATVMATDRARQRLGAAVRTTHPEYRNGQFKQFSNAALAVELGYDGLSQTRVDIAEQIAEPIDAATRWWTERLSQVWNQVSELIPGWTGQGDWVTESVGVLADRLTEHIVATLDEEIPPPLDGAGIRLVVDTAAGG